MKDSNPDAFEQTAADTTRAKADAFVRSMMRWHFEPETGTDFWLAMRDHLDFDPLRDVESFDDLKRFPDVSEHLRRTPVDALAPRGLKGQLQPLVFESGGTSGKPKHVVAYEEWMRELVDWRIARYVDRPNRPRGHTLAAVPTGPHIVGAVNRIRAQRLGGMVFSIDLDPRWVSKLVFPEPAGACTMKERVGSRACCRADWSVLMVGLPFPGPAGVPREQMFYIRASTSGRGRIRDLSAASARSARCSA